jgi:hypothetical protein
MRLASRLLLVSLLAACGGGDSGTNVPPPPPPVPVASVAITGPARLKVGDAYQFTVEARTSDGIVVQQPVTWSMDEAGAALVSGSGAVTPQRTGAMTVRATVGGVAGTLTLDAYDWLAISEGGVVGVGIDADIPVTNKFGTSDYPSLVIGCSSGTFVLGVGTSHIITASGAVSYAFDGGAPISATWLETSNFRTLGFPGSSNQSRKVFASTIAAASRFHFTFSEFQAGAKTTMFRVSGLASRLGPALAACPNNALREAQVSDEALSALLQLSGALVQQTLR